MDLEEGQTGLKKTEKLDDELDDPEIHDLQ